LRPGNPRPRPWLPTAVLPRWLRPNTLELRGHPVGPFHASYPLTDAGNVLLVPTRGHTFGHLSVIIEQPGGLRLILAGDASYRQDLMLDGVVDGAAADEKAARETLGRLQRYVREQPTRVPARPRPGIE
jgi:N-acyl homoserine lactone hydrolase